MPSKFGRRNDALAIARRTEAYEAELQHVVSAVEDFAEALYVGEKLSQAEVDTLSGNVEKLRVSVAIELADMQQTNEMFQVGIEAELAQLQRQAAEDQRAEEARGGGVCRVQDRACRLLGAAGAMVPSCITGAHGAEFRVAHGVAGPQGRVGSAREALHGALLVRRGSGSRQHGGGLRPVSAAYASSCCSGRVGRGAGRYAARAARAARAVREQ